MINVYIFTVVFIIAALTDTFLFRPLMMKLFPKYFIPLRLESLSFDLHQIDNRLEKICINNPIVYDQLVEKINTKSNYLKLKANDCKENS